MDEYAITIQLDHVVWRSDGLHDAVLEEKDAIAELAHLLEAVTDEDDRLLDLGLEALAGGRAGPSVPGAPALVLHEARVAGCDYDKLMFRAGHLGAGSDDDRNARQARRTAARRQIVPDSPRR